MTPMRTIKQRLAAVLMILVLFLSSAPALAGKATYVGKINTDKVFFRKRANDKSDYWDVLKKGVKVAVLSVDGEFYEVRYDSRRGYIMRKFVALSNSDLRRLKAADQTSSSKYAKINSISKLGDPPKPCRRGDHGDDVEKLQRALQIKKVLGGAIDGKFGNQTREALELYQRRNKLTVTGRADIATIQHIFGRVGETDAANDPGMKGITSIRQIAVPDTSRKGQSGKNVIALQQALKLKGFYKAMIDGRYGNATVTAVKAFQKANQMTQDGAAGFSTIKKLFGQNAANYAPPTERLDWFHGGSSTIPKGAIFKVKDVYSGLVFTVRRWSGYNHLDAEPLTKGDTATLTSIYGGKLSWDRRPALVKYNDHVYAASIIGMPHEDETIKDNGFPGHFCIHFYNSRTHGTNRVDEAHQSCVSRAMNARW